jgi:hypothetical protein
MRELRGRIYVTYKDKKIGSYFSTVADAEAFIDEHKKMRAFNLKRIQEETK